MNRSDLPANVCVADDVKLGANVRLAPFVNLYGCEIGDDTRIGAFVEVQKQASIGKRCKVSSHTFICSGVVIEDGVFIGHGVVFINDRHPRAVNGDGSVQSESDWELEETNRLQTLLASLYAEADADFRTADREAQELLKALVTKESLSHPAAELEFLGEIRQRNKMSLRETDSQLDLLGNYLKQRQESRSLDDTSDCAGGNSIITDN